MGRTRGNCRHPADAGPRPVRHHKAKDQRGQRRHRHHIDMMRGRVLVVVAVKVVDLGGQCNSRAHATWLAPVKRRPRRGPDSTGIGGAQAEVRSLVYWHFVLVAANIIDI